MTKVGLAFVHGYPLNKELWVHQVEHFLSGYRIWNETLPGFDATVEIDELPWKTIADLADWLAAQLKYASKTSGDPNLRWVVCGLSMGGYVVLEMIQRHPELFLGVVLTNTKASADSEEARAAREQDAEKAIREGTHAVVEPMLEKLLTPHSLEDQTLKQRVQSMMEHVPAPTIAASLRAMKDRASHVENLALITVPALVVAGAQDALIKVEESAALAKSIPQSTFVVIDDSGHLSPLEHPNEWNKAMRSFLESHQLN